MSLQRNWTHKSFTPDEETNIVLAIPPRARMDGTVQIFKKYLFDNLIYIVRIK